MRGSKFPADMHTYMMSYLHTKFHDNWISSFRGVLGRTEGQTDGVTALLDLLSPLATQVKMLLGLHTLNYFHFYHQRSTCTYNKRTGFVYQYIYVDKIRKTCTFIYTDTYL